MKSDIYRKKAIYGKRVPAFIRNGSNFFIDLHVYEDGIIDCWDEVDLEGFIEKLKKRWVRTSVPDEDSISIHELGEWRITKGKWEHDPKSFYQHIIEIIKELNPELVNLSKVQIIEKNGVQIRNSIKGTPFRESSKGKHHPEKLKGADSSIFYRFEDQYYLAQLTIFEDGILEFSRLPKTVLHNIKELEELINSEQIRTELDQGITVKIYNLGEFDIVSKKYGTDLADKVTEIKDTYNRLNDLPTSKQTCIELYRNYNENPIEENKEKLKIAYEQVPKHKRLYLGDMDVKDIPIRMIIYGEKEIENWSHRIIARKQGVDEDKLPTINIKKLEQKQNTT